MSDSLSRSLSSMERELEAAGIWGICPQGVEFISLEVLGRVHGC